MFSRHIKPAICNQATKQPSNQATKQPPNNQMAPKMTKKVTQVIGDISDDLREEEVVVRKAKGKKMVSDSSDNEEPVIVKPKSKGKVSASDTSDQEVEPAFKTKKGKAKASDSSDQEDEPVVKGKKAVKAVKPEMPDPIKEEPTVKKNRKSNLEKVLTLMQKNQTAKAIELIEAVLGKEQKVKKVREPSMFNIFVRYQMKEYKDDKGTDTREKMKKCSEVWKDEFGAFVKTKWSELKEDDPAQAVDERMDAIGKMWKKQQGKKK
jgi:hypothetical protein